MSNKKTITVELTRADTGGDGPVNLTCKCGTSCELHEVKNKRLAALIYGHANGDRLLYYWPLHREPDLMRRPGKVRKRGRTCPKSGLRVMPWSLT